MGTDYPEGLLAREPAPPYEGEGRFALWHFSEDPSLGRFRPRSPATDPGLRPLVWAVDTRHAPMFWFPRDCPRGCIWPGPATTPEDRERFFGQSAGTRLHVVETGWLERIRAARLYAYQLPAEGFRPHEVGGYWVAEEPVEAIGRVVIDDLLARHASARIELRDHAVDLAILAARGRLDRRVQRLPPAQRRPAPRSVRLASRFTVARIAGRHHILRHPDGHGTGPSRPRCGQLAQAYSRPYDGRGAAAGDRR